MLCCWIAKLLWFDETSTTCKTAQNLWLFNLENTGFQNSHTPHHLGPCVSFGNHHKWDYKIPLKSLPFLLAFPTSLSAAAVQQGPGFKHRFIPAMSLLFTCYIWAEYQIKSWLRGCLLGFFSQPRTRPAQRTFIATGARGCCSNTNKEPIKSSTVPPRSQRGIIACGMPGLCWSHKNHGERWEYLKHQPSFDHTVAAEPRHCSDKPRIKPATAANFHWLWAGEAGK